MKRRIDMPNEYRVSKGYSVDGKNGYLRRHLPAEYKDYEFRQDCIARIQMTNAFLKYHPDTDPEYARRPYLRLYGECFGVAAATEDHLFPHDRAFIDLDDDDRIPVSMTYEFTDEQIADLVLKGLFHTGFQCPDAIKNAENEFNIAFPAEITTFFPGKEAEAQGLAPLYFINLPKRDLTITQQMTDISLEKAFTPMEGLDTGSVKTPEENFVPVSARKEVQESQKTAEQVNPSLEEKPAVPLVSDNLESKAAEEVIEAKSEKPKYYWDDGIEDIMLQESREKIAAATKLNAATASEKTKVPSEKKPDSKPAVLKKAGTKEESEAQPAMAEDCSMPYDPLYESDLEEDNYDSVFLDSGEPELS